jgi:rare lipoprotein A
VAVRSAATPASDPRRSRTEALRAAAGALAWALAAAACASVPEPGIRSAPAGTEAPPVEVARARETPRAGDVPPAGERPRAEPPSGRGRVKSVQLGKATYYAPRLAGHLTANGERYDPGKLTAAHPTLPFGTRVRVVRLDREGKEVVVRINDRCAGVKKIIDLSEVAARRLDMMRAGRVPVRLEILARGD